jgi:hypothetical protein
MHGQPARDLALALKNDLTVALVALELLAQRDDLPPSAVQQAQAAVRRLESAVARVHAFEQASQAAHTNAGRPAPPRSA